MDFIAISERKQTKRLGQFLDEQTKIKARMKRRWEQNEADQKRLSYFKGQQ